MMMIIFILLSCLLLESPTTTHAALKVGFYEEVCPQAEATVARVLAKNFPISVPSAIRLILHDCFVEGCDGSILINTTNPEEAAERDHPENKSLLEVAFDNIIQAKAAIDEIPGCKNKVSCADIIVMAARDAIKLAGGPEYPVELGRLDGMSSNSRSVEGKLPHANFNLDQLVQMFEAFDLTQTEMVALSGAHTIGFSRCNQFATRLYNFSTESPTDPSLNSTLAESLRGDCPEGVNPGTFVPFDPPNPIKFDNSYYKQLQQNRGLLSSDQVLHTDPRSRPTVDRWANDAADFDSSFVAAITKLARLGVKTEEGQGEIRVDCTRFN